MVSGNSNCTYDNSKNDFVFSVNSGGVTVNVETVDAGFIFGGWDFVVCWHDAETNQIGISANGTFPIGIATVSGGLVPQPTAPFWVGTKDTYYSYWDGRIDDTGFWKRVFTLEERTRLYNKGRGLPYPFENTLFTDLIAYYPFEDGSARGRV